MTHKEKVFEESVASFFIGAVIGIIGFQIFKAATNKSNPWSKPWEESSNPLPNNTTIDFS
jgi:hypothetical protein